MIPLSKYAETRGLKSELGGLKAKGWSIGASYTVRGKSIDHTCLLSPAKLAELIWRAEIMVLMPYIEEQRQELLRKYQQLLQMPFTTAGGEQIDNLYDLEIGQIERQLLRCAAITRGEIDWISALKKARNSLSHLEPVDANVLSSILQHVDE
jgi:hypothetical protein